MLSAEAGSIPVTDGDRLIGMITDRDIAVRGIAKGYGPDTPVRELMSDDVVCARDDDDVEDVASRMSEAQVRRLPVIDEEERLCGIVSLGDLSREADEDCAGKRSKASASPAAAPAVTDCAPAKRRRARSAPLADGPRPSPGRLAPAISLIA